MKVWVLRLWWALGTTGRTTASQPSMNHFNTTLTWMQVDLDAFRVTGPVLN